MRSSVTATRRAWSAARGRYHSRSQWVCGIKWKISPVIAPKAKGIPGVPRAPILRLMLKRSLLALPAIAGAALLVTRLVPGSLPDGSTLLPSGWRIRPAGRAVPVGTLPLNLVTLSDGSVMVTNDGYGENSLMRIDPVRAHVVWRVPVPAAWLGLARTGRDWRDTVWASGGPTNRAYRFAWQGGASGTRDSVALADSRAKLYPAGPALPPRHGLVAG